MERVHYDKMTPNSLLVKIVSLILISRTYRLIRKGLVVEQSTKPIMKAWRVWLGRQKIVSPKYHRGQFFLQAQTDPNILMIEGT
jgi:hypothetical protein